MKASRTKNQGLNVRLQSPAGCGTLVTQAGSLLDSVGFAGCQPAIQQTTSLRCIISRWKLGFSVVLGAWNVEL